MGVNDNLRDAVAHIIVAHQPKPIPINFQEASVIADALLVVFNIKVKPDDD